MTEFRISSAHPLAPVALAVALLMAAPAQATNYNWGSGSYSTSGLPGSYLATDVLNVGSAGYKYFDTSATSAGTVRMLDNMYVQNGSSFGNTGLFDVQGDFGFIDAGYSGSIVNSGTFQKSAGSGATTFSNVGFTNNGGVISAQSGSINFSSGAFNFNNGTQFTGAGQSIVSGNANFAGSLTANNLTIASGTATGNASVVSGALNWSGGTLGGDWTVAAGQSVNVQGGGYKYMNGTLTNKGSVNVTDNIYFYNANGFVNQALFDLQGDVGLYDGGYGGNFVNTGTFRKSAGSGTSSIAINGYGFTNNGGTIEAKAGVINFSSGALNFNAGGVFTGAGQVLITNNANFAGASTASNLTLASGTFTGSGAVMMGAFNWSGGSLAGDWAVAAGQTLNVQAGGYKYVNAAVTNLGSIVATDTLYFQNGNGIANAGVYVLQGDVGLADGGYGGNFVNTGTLRKSVGSGSSTIGVNGYGFTSNGGTVDAQTGTIDFNAGALSFNDGSKFIGAGQVVVSNNAGFAGNLTGSNLTLTGGTQTGSGAVINGSVGWIGGSLAGTWAVAAGQTLKLQSGGYHYLNGTLTNGGTIAATDTLYLQNGNVLNNQALHDLQGDVGIGDGGYGGNYVNTGTLRKSVGSGTSYVGFGGTGFTSNGGTSDAQTGTINFNSGGLNFNDGTLFKGAGQNVVSSNATFTGNITSQNLQLASGTMTGGNGTAGSKAVFIGATAWSGGSTLAGNVELAAAHTLNIQAGGYKYVNGTVTNNGLVNAADTVYLQNGNQFVNNGRYNVQGDVGVADGGYNGSFVNNGVLVKSAGTGTTDLSAVGFVNNGTVQVATGTIQLPANFSNAGTLTGSGSFATNLLTNNGHVAPGNSPGTLTLGGNFAQTALGSLDIELQSLASFDKFVVSGSASLGGRLALSCFGSCNLAVGQTFIILDAAPNALTGSFASVTLSGFATGAFNVIYDLAGGDVMLQVTQAATAAAVPEGQTWALMMAGLGVLGWLGKRRRA